MLINKMCLYFDQANISSNYVKFIILSSVII